MSFRISTSPVFDLVRADVVVLQEAKPICPRHHRRLRVRHNQGVVVGQDPGSGVAVARLDRPLQCVFALKDVLLGGHDAGSYACDGWSRQLGETGSLPAEPSEGPPI